MATYLDLDEHIKPFLGLGPSDDSEDPLLKLLNKQSASRLDQVLNVSTLEKHTVTDERFDGGVQKIYTRDFPVISVTTIKQGSTEVVHSQVDAYLIERRNIVRINGAVSGGTGYEQSKITYLAGYVTFDQNKTGGAYVAAGVDFPDDLAHANLLLLAGMYNQKKSIGVRSYALQGRQVSFRDDVEGGEFEKIVKQYKKALVLSI